VGTMPKEALYPGCGYHPDDKKFVNLSSEQIYEWLVKSGTKPPDEPDGGGEGDSPDSEIVIGDVIRDTKTNTYGVVRSIDPSTGEIDFDPISESDVTKYLK